jgi:hypothetical protein
MNHSAKSRRNFLGIMGILTSGTVIAGSPLCLLEEKETVNESLQRDWTAFVENNKATRFFNLTGIDLQTKLVPIDGQQNKAGDIMHLSKENILVLPTWIHWNNSVKAKDVVISFFENSYPYKKIKSINRFELTAINKLSTENTDTNILQTLCIKNTQATSPKSGISARINKSRRLQNVTLYCNHRIILKENLFYNA